MIVFLAAALVRSNIVEFCVFIVGSMSSLSELHNNLKAKTSRNQKSYDCMSEQSGIKMLNTHKNFKHQITFD